MEKADQEPVLGRRVVRVRYEAADPEELRRRLIALFELLELDGELFDNAPSTTKIKVRQ
jgi:hypothetical protein